MSIEALAVGDSPLHRIDPRVRLTAAAAFATVVAVSYRLPALGAALAAAVLLAALARLPAEAVATRLAAVNGWWWCCGPCSRSPSPGRRCCVSGRWRPRSREFEWRPRSRSSRTRSSSPS